MDLLGKTFLILLASHTGSTLEFYPEAGREIGVLITQDFIHFNCCCCKKINVNGDEKRIFFFFSPHT